MLFKHFLSIYDSFIFYISNALWTLLYLLHEAHSSVIIYNTKNVLFSTLYTHTV
jgi:hypothetical protein